MVFVLLGAAVVANARAELADDADVAAAKPALVHEQDVPRAPAAASKAAAADRSGPTVVAELPQTTVKSFSMLGVTWDPDARSADLDVSVRWRHGGRWSSWTHLDLELASGAEGGRPGTEPQWTDTSDGVAVRVTSTSGHRPTGLRVALIDPREGADVRPVAATVAQPAIILRSAWGASAGGTCSSPVYGASTLGAVIHHTAGSNTYTKAQSAGIVKATQAYHINSRDWCDIGYNFLVDKYGQIFEGRKGGITKPVRAAHSGNDAVNQQTMGVSLMGTFSSTEPTAAMKSAVADLVAWRFAQYKRPAKGTYSLGGKTLNRIAGHRNVVSTECPGAKVYAWLSASGGLRDAVETRLAKGTTDPVESLPDGVSRVGGADRYETAAQISSESHPNGASTVFVASGNGYADGLSGGPASLQRSAPVLLTAPTSLPAATKAEITRLKPSTIYLLGGASVVDQKVLDALKPLAATVKRISGANRYETAARVGTTFWDTSRAVYLASGTGFADALSGGAAASRTGAPMLLTAPTSLPSATKNALATLKPSKIVLVGGTAVISDAVSQQLESLISGVSIARYGGADRWETSAKLMNAQWSPPIGTVMLASGATYPDALAGAPAAKTLNAAFALSGKTCVPYEVNKVLGSSKPKYILLGGSSALTAAVSQNVCDKPKPPSTPSQGSDTVTVPSSGDVKLQGRGYGHGIGMSQYGAQGAAKQGKTYAQILDYYYPGTSISTKSTNIRVLISAATSSTVTVKAQSGLRFRYTATDKVFTLPSTMDGRTVSQWRIIPLVADPKQSVLQYRTDAWHPYDRNFWVGDAQFEAVGGKVTLYLPGGTTRQYRSIIRSAVPSKGATTRKTVNLTNIDNYTLGVVASEMPSSWDPDALKAQSIAARTYGIRSVHSGGYYDICDTTSCQVYKGVAGEASGSNAAAVATNGMILTYEGSPAFTQFSSSSGGVSAAGSQPYLKAKVDAYDDWSGNPNHAWTKTIKASTLEKAYPSIGTLQSMSISKRSGIGEWGGRVITLTLKGSKGSTSITGPTARSVLGLRSDFFRFA